MTSLEPLSVAGREHRRVKRLGGLSLLIFWGTSLESFVTAKCKDVRAGYLLFLNPDVQKQKLKNIHWELWSYKGSHTRIYIFKKNPVSLIKRCSHPLLPTNFILHNYSLPLPLFAFNFSGTVIDGGKRQHW